MSNDMSKRTILWLMIAVFILTGSTILCTLRWDAWFTIPQEPTWTADTLSMRFTTFNDDTIYNCQTTDTLTMVVLGDVHNTLSQSDYLSIADQCPEMQCYAQLGDFVEREQFYYKQQLMHQLQGTPFDSLPVMVCPGNHEYFKGLHRYLPESWYESFKLPKSDLLYDKGSTYYVDFRHLRFIAIDTEDPQLISDHTRLNAWVKNAIRSACQPWVVVMMHRPVYSSRKGRANPIVWLTLCHALGKADVIYSGHEHTYARKGDALQTDEQLHHPVWIGITSTTRSRTPKQRSRMDTIVAGGPYYSVMQATEHELSVRTYRLDATCIDSVALYKR